MIRSLALIRTHCTDPYRNLALERTLLESVREGQCILYLWQNEKTVVIGRNQNAFAECDPGSLIRDGGHLVRRLSGGGAVFHDLGNLNFTFFTKTEDADRQKETQVILEAVNSLGIRAERTGRNDLVCDGRKFSGHAYYRSGDACYHHGTLMLSVDPALLSRYLRVSPVKMKKRGVSSVRSRVMNLCDVRPDLTVDKMADALARAFAAVYGLPCEELSGSDLDPEAIRRAEETFASREWIWGRTDPLPFHTEALFPDGLYRLDFETVPDADGVPVFGRTLLSSDSLETGLDYTLAERLRGCPADPDAVLQRLGAEADSPARRVLLRLTEELRRQP